MKSLADEQGSVTHPARGARLAAIINGWKQAESLRGKVDPTTQPNPNPERQTPPSNPIPQQTTTIVARCVFFQDPNGYFVTSANTIVGVSSNGQQAIVGQRMPPAMPAFQWMYATAYRTYGVDAQGKIWGMLPNGQLIQVGYVTGPN